VALHARRQADAAGIPDTVVGPEFPRGKGSSAGECRATDKKIASFQAGQFFI
jgi:hypothetical protein